MSDRTPLDLQLTQLRERFTERTLNQLQDLLAQLNDWQPGQPHRPLMDALGQLLHRLAGSSGTFGMHALGQQAARQEQWLKDQRAANARNNNQDAELVAQARAGLSTLMTLTQSATLEPAQSPAVAFAPEQPLDLLILGGELKALAGALSHYGFNLQHLDDDKTLPDRGWHPHLIILTNSEQLQRITRWNRHQAQAHDHQPVPILCAGSKADFSARYHLAEQGVDGLFSLPADVPGLVERIEQLRQSHSQTRQPRVLLLDDDRELAGHYRLVMTNAGMKVRVLNQPNTLMSVLAEFRPDIVLMDIHMPPWSGTTLARMIRFEPQWLSLPIVYLSSEQDRDRQLSALAQGADEFITKPISDPQLVRTVSILCERARQLSQLLSSDGLTGLLNHPHIKQALTHEHERVRRLGHATVVAMLDLDHFKQVNDTHGHATGDRVIRTLAHLLKRRLRKTDRLGRYGGEEFVAILPDCAPEKAHTLFELICRDFAALDFRGPEQEFQVTVSVGLAQLNDFATAEEALNAADDALYERKRHGRNGVTDYAELQQPESNG